MIKNISKFAFSKVSEELSSIENKRVRRQLLNFYASYILPTKNTSCNTFLLAFIAEIKKCQF